MSVDPFFVVLVDRFPLHGDHGDHMATTWRPWFVTSQEKQPVILAITYER